VALKEIHRKIMGKNGYFDILLLSGRATYRAKWLGHILRNINSNIVAFQTHTL
jgi:hypothetical protein